MKVKRLMAPRPFPLTLIGFPPGCARILRARSTARMHVKCIRDNPVSPPACAGEGGEPSALTRDLVHLGATA